MPEEFGANEWLVEEMYERFQADPSSVDQTWVDYFKAHGNGTPSGSDNGSPSSSHQRHAPAHHRDQARSRKPEPSPQARATADEGDHRSGRPTSTRPRPRRRWPSRVRSPRPPSRPRARPARSPRSSPRPRQTDASDEPTYTVLRGAPARTAANMDTSLTVPTATSVRSVPVKLLWDNRTVINNHLARARGGKVSFTHLIGYALVKALRPCPEMNVGFDTVDGKPNLVKPAHVNLGLAIDMQKPDGTRQLLVPSIKGAERMDFAAFWTAYEDIVRKARDNKLTVEDFQGTTISLTNPGGIGTSHSVPRLMKGQGAIIGVGAMEYPPEWQGASEDAIARNAISKVMTLTSTYDHRVIQGAQSGEFLKRMHQLLLGEDGFYDEIFRSLRIPYEPIRWSNDISTRHDDEISKQARILELIHAYRVRGHMMADTDPLEYRQRSHPDLEVETHALTLWDLDREFATGSFGGEGRRFMKLRAHPRASCATPTAAPPASSTCTSWIPSSASGSRSGSSSRTSSRRARSSCGSCSSSTRPRRSRRSCRPSSSARSGSASRAARRRSRCSTRSARRPPRPASTRSRSAWPTAAGSTCWPTSSARSTPRSSASSRATSTRGPSRAPAT